MTPLNGTTRSTLLMLVLRHEQEVARLQHRCLGVAIGLGQLLGVDDPVRPRCVVVEAAEQHDLGMLGARLEAAGHRDGFEHADPAAQLELSGLAHFAADDEARLLELLQLEGHLRIAQPQPRRLGRTSRAASADGEPATLTSPTIGRLMNPSGWIATNRSYSGV